MFSVFYKMSKKNQSTYYLYSGMRPKGILYFTPAYQNIAH